MELQTAYRQRSRIAQTPVGLAVSLSPNLRRDRVSFVGTLRHPLRFREAVSALHDVVISDLRFKPKDKTRLRGVEEAGSRARAAHPHRGRRRSSGAELEAAQEPADARGAGEATSSGAGSATGTPATSTARCSPARTRSCGGC